MHANIGWDSYAQQSFNLQWGKGERTKRTSPRHAPNIRALMRPGEVKTSWPGWNAASIRSWW